MKSRSFIGATIDHVAIRVSNFNSSVRLYGSVFGTGSVGIVDSESFTGRVDLIHVGPGSCIELFEATKGQANPMAGSVGVIHFALAVDNVDVAYEQAVSAGATPMRAPQDTVLPLHKGAVIRAAFVFGPDGEVIELIARYWAEPLFTAQLVE